MIKESAKKSILICSIGYVLIIVSALMLSLIVRILTGYFPSFTFFTLALITFRLFEINYAFLLVPLFVAILVMMLLSRPSINTRIAGGMSLTSYYAFVALIYMAMRSGDFPYLALIPWFLFVFFLGYTSVIISEKLE
ncbi:MAG: hypothetical protein NWF08_06925 [Candidatus Bathyarchaeota archaeon]|nr:hypothetical protein [Candidatus Bathyarchaeota archaeon]